MSDNGRYLEYLAERIEGVYSEPDSKTGERVVATIQGRPMVLDVERTPLFDVRTRYRTLFVATDQFQFRLSPPDFDTPTTLRRVLGRASDVKIGVPYFDEKYLIEATDTEKVRLFLDEPVLREQIRDLGKFCLEIRSEKDYPREIAELRLTIAGKTEEIARLHYLFDLMGKFMERLVHQGSASPELPTIEL
jgi:hypothetical protein